MTQEEQTALVDGQQAVAAAATDAKKDEQQAVKTDTEAAEAGKGSTNQAEENQAQMRALFKQFIRLRSVRKLSPAAKAAKAARQAARAAANAAKAAEVAAKAADNAAKAAQDAAQAAFDENAKAEGKKVVEKAAEVVKSETVEAAKQEEVAAK